MFRALTLRRHPAYNEGYDAPPPFWILDFGFWIRIGQKSKIQSLP